MGRALSAVGKNEEGLEAFGRAEAIDKKIRTPDHPMWGYLWTEQARSREGLKQYPAAIDLLEKALKLRPLLLPRLEKRLQSS